MNPQELKKFINESYIHSDERSKFIDELASGQREQSSQFQYDEDLSNNKASVYYNPNTKQATITHRGTNETASDWKNNLALALGVYDFTTQG